MFGFKSDPRKDFWKWFSANAPAIRREISGGGGDWAVAIHGLGAQLRKVHPGLVHEIGMPDPQTLELIISGDGIKANFPAVVDLVNSAPSVPGFKITAFKPRTVGNFGLRMLGKDITAEMLTYRFVPEGDVLGFELFIDSDLDERSRGIVGFVVLDQWLGEYDVATGLGWIEFAAGRPTDAHPIEQLPGDFDSRKPRTAH